MGGEKTPVKALVTGGGGFLGGALIDQLLAEGARVTSFSRNTYPALTAKGVKEVKGDLADEGAVREAIEGCDTLFHVAAKAGIWGSYDDYYRSNVVGTENIIKACKNSSVSRLIYTSSPSVVFNGKDMEGVDESLPYPSTYKAFYPQTKAIAEKMVLEANGSQLATVALRPHLIWGPGDNHLIPRIISRAKAGKLKKVGSGKKLIDSTYVGDAAHAHILAAKNLKFDAPPAGKAYFISQGDPRPLWELVSGFLMAAGLPPVEKGVPVSLAYGVGILLEFLYRTFSISGEPIMTRFLARELSTAHWFDISAARKDFGYSPNFTIEEGMERLKKHLSSPSEKS